MEFRKLISFGKTSFVMSLPKSWIIKNNLKKGDLLSIEEKDGNLVLSSRKEKISKPDSKEIVIDLGNKDIKHDLQREITSAYINNFNTIIVSGKGVMEKTPLIRDCFTKLIALEAVEQTSDKIIAKDYLNMEKISIVESFKKMDMIVRSMMSDLKMALDKDIYENLHHRDHDVNRLSFLLYRAIRHSFDDPDINKIYGLHSNELIIYWVITSLLEKIGDNVKRIAKNLQDIKSKKSAENIIDLYSMAEKRYLDTMKSFYTGNIKLAYTLARSKTNALVKCKEMVNDNKDKGVVVDTVDKIAQIISDTHDITRMVYLYLPYNS